MRDLHGKVVVVTGANGGVGREICHLLVGEGARLAIASRNATALSALEASMTATGGKVVAMALDVTAEADVVAFYDRVKHALGRVDILVNLAGLSTPYRIAEMPVEQYDLTMDVNLKGTFLFAKHFVPLVDTEEGGQIVNFGSMAAKRANANNPMYSTAKAAVNMFSQSLALQLIDRKIRVTTLNPGPIDTGFWGDRPVPREKFMQARDVADVLLFVLKVNPAIVMHEVSFDPFAFFK